MRELKILYGINTIGQGHINRSHTIINQLRKDGHHVDCVFSGPKPPKYAYDVGDRWIRVHGYHMEFNELGAIPARTLLNNILKIKLILKSLLTSFRLTLNENYDAIISDFEISTTIAGFLLRKPVIIVDHQHSLIHPGSLRAPGKLFDILNMLFSLAMTIPYFTHVFTLDLVPNPIRRFRETLFPLTNKPEIETLPISVKNHYCVYLPYIPLKKLYEVFTQFPKFDFHIYGFNINKKIKNLCFKRTTREGFLKNMATSKGIISHAGFSLIWEAILLKKPFYVIPLEGHYEQQANAFRLSHKKLAYVENDLTKQHLKNFINECFQLNYQKTRNINIIQPKILMKFIYEEIQKFNHRKLILPK